MGTIVRWVSAGAVLAVAIVVVAGCGVNEQKLVDAQTRIEALQGKGVPDTMLTDARVLLSNARGFLQSGNSAMASRDAAEMFKIIDRVEEWFATGQEQLKPEIDAKRKQLAASMEALSGPQREVADSLLQVIDDLLAKGWVLQARQQLLACDTAFLVLVADEARMKQVTDNIVGFWGEQAEDKTLGVVRTKKFSFLKDGKIELVEDMKGKTADDMKEDWKYSSTGLWKVKGDTVFINVQREKREKMIIENRIGGKWVKRIEPPYDSTYTDGRKDVFITYTYMLENMKKIGK